MYERFDTVTLATGERAELGRVLGPDEGDPLGVAELLGHKGQAWEWHVTEALARPLDGLETRWYLARLDGRSVSNVMTVEHAGVGILGHVFTRPEHRRKGLCRAIFERLLPDFRDRGGLRLTLGTGYDSPPYWIYHGFGFRSVVPETGFMACPLVEDFAARWYAPGPTQVADLSWRHWPTLAQLFTDDPGQGLQALCFNAFGPTNIEGSFVSAWQGISAGQGAVARVLERESGAVVGFAALAPDARWQRKTWLLDLLLHPSAVDQGPDLLAALPFPDAPVQAWVPAVAAGRRAALEASGFGLAAELRRQLPDGGDVALYVR